MIYGLPDVAASIDQGDIIGGCPIASIARFDPATPGSPQVQCALSKVVILTQTCDLAQGKTDRALVAVVCDADELVRQGIFKPAEIRGQIRSGRIYGVYFLPAEPQFGVPESIVDLRQLHSIDLILLNRLCSLGKRIARIQPLDREHLAKHFADTYSRIGLPEPYPSE